MNSLFILTNFRLILLHPYFGDPESIPLTDLGHLETKIQNTGIAFCVWIFSLAFFSVSWFTAISLIIPLGLTLFLLNVIGIIFTLPLIGLLIFLPKAIGRLGRKTLIITTTLQSGHETYKIEVDRPDIDHEIISAISENLTPAEIKNLSGVSNRIGEFYWTMYYWEHNREPFRGSYICPRCGKTVDLDRNAAIEHPVFIDRNLTITNYRLILPYFVPSLFPDRPTFDLSTIDHCESRSFPTRRMRIFFRVTDKPLDLAIHCPPEAVDLLNKLCGKTPQAGPIDYDEFYSKYQIKPEDKPPWS